MNPDELINCQVAMMELDLSYDGMAELLQVSRSIVVRMCLNDEQLTEKQHQKVMILLNLHRPSLRAESLIMDMAEEFLVRLHNLGGKLRLEEAKAESGMSGQQLKNLEYIKGWITLVWEKDPKRYSGTYPAVYLTKRGYDKLGVPVGARSMPSEFARPMEIKGAGEAQQVLFAAFNRQIDSLMRTASEIRNIQTSMVVGLVTPSQALELYDVVTTGKPKAIENKE